MKNKAGTILKVSVIIPVYNVEKYLAQCLDSVLSQTLRDIEVICIDDGSTDNSLKILQKYAAKDKRVTVLQQKNKGAGPARNAGMKIAKGEFIAFMDSDDLYPSDKTLENMYKTAVKHKVSICGGSLYYLKNGELVKDPSEFEVGYTFAADGMIEYKDYQFDYGYSRFIYKRTFLQENQLYFPDYLRGEDPPFFIKAMALAERFYALQEATYVYRVLYKKVEWTERKSLSVLQSMIACLKLAKEYNYDKMKEAFKRRANSYYFQNFVNPFIDSNKIMDALFEINVLAPGLLDSTYTRILSKYTQSPLADADGNIKVSVIMPVYNVEQYLAQCLDSVLSQTLQDIEVICIDDGSTDNSLKILHKYAAKDKRITVLQQKNKGAGAARNAGMKIAKGEFVAFMDSDDLYPNKETLAKMYRAAIINDVLICGGSLNKLNKNVLITNPAKFEDGYTFAADGVVEYKDYQFDYGYWRFIYKRTFLRKNKLYFPDYLRGQDPPFFIKAMALAEKFYALKVATYVYRVSHKEVAYNERKTIDMLNSIMDCLTLAREYGYDKIKEAIKQRINQKYFKNIIIPFVDNKKVRNTLFDVHNLAPDVLDCSYLQILSEYIQSPLPDSDGDKKVAVIIPVYNVEQYLAQCLDSVVNQTMSEIEIICVDDGSTDNSAAILKQYAARDKRIKVIKKPNGGLGAARNVGIISSSAPYMMFLDSDDFIELNTVEKLYHTMVQQKVDVVVSGIKCFNDDGTITDSLKSKQKWCDSFIHAGRQLIPGNIRSYFCPTAVDKLYRRDIIEKYDIRFPEGLINEDEYWLWAYMIHCRVCFCLKDKFYLYRQRPNSIMGTRCNSTRILDAIDIHGRIYQTVAQYEKIPAYIDNMTFYALGHMKGLYRMMSNGCNDLYRQKVTDYVDKYNHSEKLLAYRQFINTKVSVIVPISHDTEYLQKCLDSLQNQTLRNIEIICVDDGSTDSAAEIIKQYAAEDNRFIFLSQKNAGSAAARNLGLQKATGDYIGFVDSDDYVAENYFESLLTCALENEAEIAATSAVKLSGASGTTPLMGADYKYKNILSSVEDKGRLFLFFGDLCNKIYSAKLLRKHNSKGSKADNYLTDAALIAADKIAVTDKANYFCRTQPVYSTDVSDCREINKFIGSLKLSEEETQLWSAIVNLRQSYNCLTATEAIYKEFFAKYNLLFIPIVASVIIAAYNAEEYIAECLDSLVKQTLNKIEIVCVNDGSSDGTLQIMRQYAQKDQRIKIINQENQRQACARNNALKIAKGKYIVFVDADDYIAPNAVEKIYKRMESNNLDMLSYGGINFNADTRQEEKSPYYDFAYLPEDFDTSCFTWKECKKFLPQMAVSTCLNAYKSEFVSAAKLQFPPHVYFEDNLFFVRAITKARRVGIMTDTLYYRRLHSDSVTHCWNKNCLDYIKVATMVLEYLRTFDKSLFKKYSQYFCNGIKSRFKNFDAAERKKYNKPLHKFLSTYEKYTKETPEKQVNTYKLFNFLPILTVKQRGGRKTYKTLGLPIWTIRKMADGLTTKCYFCGLPILKKQCHSNKITTKYKLLGLPFLKVSRRKVKSA